MLRFRVDTALPSLENYRGRGKTAAPEKREKSERQYRRIMATKELIGWSCREAAKPGQIGAMFGKPVSIHITLYNQRIDCDNVKLVIDSLKHIVYPDDKKKFVRRVCAEHGDDGLYSGEPVAIISIQLYKPCQS